MGVLNQPETECACFRSTGHAHSYYSYNNKCAWCEECMKVGTISITNIGHKESAKAYTLINGSEDSLGMLVCTLEQKLVHTCKVNAHSNNIATGLLVL